MLNKEQLAILNEIFINEIVPVFEEEASTVEKFMVKIDEHEKWLQNSMIEEINRILLTSFKRDETSATTTQPYLSFYHTALNKTIKQFVSNEYDLQNQFTEDTKLKSLKTIDNVQLQSVSQNTFAA